MVNKHSVSFTFIYYCKALNHGIYYIKDYHDLKNSFDEMKKTFILRLLNSDREVLVRQLDYPIKYCGYN